MSTRSALPPSTPPSVEDRLRAAFAARADLVTPQTLTPALPPAVSRPPRPRALLAAAAAVTVLAAAVGTGFLLDDSGKREPNVATTPGPTPTPTPSETPTPTPSPTPTDTPTSTPPSKPSTSAPVAGSAAAPYDVDGDGRPETVELRSIASGGWEVALTRSSTGELLTSPLLPEWVAEKKPAVVGSGDLDLDGHAEVLVRVVQAAQGDNYLVVRWTTQTGLIVFAGGSPWEIATSGGMSGPRSFACVDTLPGRKGREVLTVDPQRDDSAGQEPTYSGTVTTWGFDAKDRAVVLDRSTFKQVTLQELGALGQGGPNTCGIDWS